MGNIIDKETGHRKGISKVKLQTLLDNKSPVYVIKLLAVLVHLNMNILKLD